MVTPEASGKAVAPEARGKTTEPEARSRAVGQKRRVGTAFLLGGLVCGMVGLAFGAVPLYDLFCRVTGFGGTTQVADTVPTEVGDRMITIRFNADIARDLPWRFKPEQREMTVRVGEMAMAFYVAKNQSNRDLVGTSTFNVTPVKAGAYFNKMDCFCFEEQTLAAGESAELPVSFFVDPEIAEDRRLDDVSTITLSYTFFSRDDDDETAEASLETPRSDNEAGG